jgi:hypothetical protein
LPDLSIRSTGFIGTNITGGFLSICASNSFSSSSSRIKLNDSSINGKLQLFSGFNTNGNIEFYTANDSLKMNIKNSGTIEFSPNGSNISCSIDNNFSSFTNQIIFYNSSNSSNFSSGGALSIYGGLSVSKNAYINSIISSSCNSDFISSKSLFLSSSSDSLGIGSGGSLTVLGGCSISKNLLVGGTITSLSDERVKDNISLLNDDIIDLVDNIRCVRFNFTGESHKHIGFIAQDFIPSFPELVSFNDSNLYSLNYQNTTSVLLKCIQVLHNKIKSLESRLT